MDQDTNQHVLVHSMESEFADESLCENYSQSDVEDTLTDQGHLDSGSRSSLFDIFDNNDFRAKSGTDDSEATIRDASPVSRAPGEGGRTDTPSESIATESALYETPFTSASGFDVYLTAFEESSHSLDKVLKLDSLIEIPATTSSSIRPIKEVMAKRDSELPIQKPQSKGGKGGERLGSTGKCTPKKTMPSPKNEPDTQNEEPMTKSPPENPKTPNGSVKSERSGNLKAISKSIKGGTKALLIQKVSKVCMWNWCMLSVYSSRGDNRYKCTT